MKERRTLWNTRVPTWPHDTEAMVGIALGLKQGPKQEDNTQTVKSYKRKRKGGRRKSVEVSGYTRIKPR